MSLVYVYLFLSDNIMHIDVFLLFYARDWQYEVISRYNNFWANTNITQYVMDKPVSESC
jgi:hypothetical protein